MKITKKQLKRIIIEEKTKLLKEARRGWGGVGFASWSPNHNVDFAKAYGKDAQEIGLNRRIQEQPDYRSPEHGLDVIVPDDDSQFLAAEDALESLIEALAMMSPEEAGEMARYAIDELHGYKI